MSSFVARKYRYADGTIHNPNRFTLYHVENGEAVRGVGGMVKVRDVYLAFAGPTGEGGDPARVVKLYPHAWGNTLREALQRIKPKLEARL